MTRRAMGTVSDELACCFQFFNKGPGQEEEETAFYHSFFFFPIFNCEAFLYFLV